MRRLVDVFLVVALVVCLVGLAVPAEARHRHPNQEICMTYPVAGGGFVIRCYWLHGHRGHGHAWGHR